MAERKDQTALSAAVRTKGPGRTGIFFQNDTRNRALLILLLFFMVLLPFAFGRVFGSKTDWLQQHWTIPEYFRTLFYDTGNFFPSFAPHLGAGQNLYYFSYYGLYSPVVLFSYLLPFVPMMYYMIAASVLALVADLFLFYRFVRNKHTAPFSFFLTLLFLFSAPLLYHSHHHLMYVNYMPFLLLSLFGVERVFKGKGGGMLTVSALCLLTSSYFFAPVSFGVILLYAIYCAMKRDASAKRFCEMPFSEVKKRPKRGFGAAAGKKLLKVLFSLFTAGLLAGVLIVPTLFVIANGREAVSVAPALRRLLPHVNLSNFLYSAFSVGLSSLSFLAPLLLLFWGQKPEKMLAAFLIFFSVSPLFLYFLSGGMYAEGKLYIPLLPLFLLLTGQLLEMLKKRRPPFFMLLPLVGVSALLSAAGFFLDWDAMTNRELVLALFLLDTLFVLLGITLLYRKEAMKPLLFLTMAVVLLTAAAVNFSENFVRREEVDLADRQNIRALYEAALERGGADGRFGSQIDAGNTPNAVYGPDFHRTTLYSSLHNKNYDTIFRRIFANEILARNNALIAESQNPLFALYFGIRFQIAPADSEIGGYQKILTEGDYALFEADHALPLGFVYDRYLSEEAFTALEYPNKTEALFNYIVVKECKTAPPGGADDSFRSDIDFRTERLTMEENALFSVDPSGKNFLFCDKRGYAVSSDAALRRSLSLEGSAGKFVFVSFAVDNREKANRDDVWVEINGVRNTLTRAGWKYHNHNDVFHYVFLAGNEDLTLDFTFSSGRYSLKDFAFYTLPAEGVLSFPERLDSLKIDRARTRGDSLFGTVDVTRAGMMQITIPYDEGFAVKVDGRNVDHDKTSALFLTFPIEAGLHEIEVTFTAPGLAAGKILSALGVALFLLSLLWEFWRENRA